MISYERRQLLLDLLRRKPGLRMPEIAREIGVSESTVRNDLNTLEVEGVLTRVHGGAVLNAPRQGTLPPFDVRNLDHPEQKAAIGKLAASLVQDGDSILLDGSSTDYYLALSLKERSNLRVVTNGIEVARLLAHNPSHTVILIGGVVQSDGSSVTGLLSEQVISELRVQKAFVSCSGFSMERGMTDLHLGEAQLKRKTILAAHQVFALVDSSKLGHEDLTVFARPSQITHLFTDSGISEDWKARLQSAGIPYTICN